MNLTLPKNDRRARWLIFGSSAVVFAAVTVLERVTLAVDLGFNPHVFAAANAVINSVVAVLLVAGLIAAKQRKLVAHRNIMLAAIGLSVIFLLTYIAHHLFAGSTWYGDADRDGVVSTAEKLAVGSSRWVYFLLLSTHILLAGLSLPFILFSAYRGLTGEYIAHRRISKITWPLWLYVAVTGPVVYLMISQYY